MDQLHFDLWWRGLNIAQDAGTFVYEAPRPWDNPLVSTRVHNTVTVDGRDQMTRAGRFLTLDWFPAYSKSVIPADDKALGSMLAYHKGYRRLGVRHERLVTVYRGERWEIRDMLLLTRPGEHLFRLHWLLPDWNYQTHEAPFELVLKAPQGKVTVRIESDPPLSGPGVRVSLARAGRLVFGEGTPSAIDGWASPIYGTKIPALSLAVQLRSSRSVSFVTEFLLATTTRKR